MPLKDIIYIELAGLFETSLKHDLKCTCHTCRKFVLKYLEALSTLMKGANA